MTLNLAKSRPHGWTEATEKSSLKKTLFGLMASASEAKGFIGAIPICNASRASTSKLNRTDDCISVTKPNQGKKIELPGGQSMDSQILLPFKVSKRLLFLPDFKLNV